MSVCEHSSSFALSNDEERQRQRKKEIRIKSLRVMDIFLMTVNVLGMMAEVKEKFEKVLGK